MSTTALLVCISAGLLLLAGVTSLGRKLMAAAVQRPASIEWFSLWSPDFYRPMARLLDESEIRTMQREGCDPAAIRRFRAGRRKAFRRYLDAMIKDFSRSCTFLRMLAAQSNTDRSPLMGFVVQQQIRFMSAVALVEIRLAVHALGIGTVDIAPLLGPLEQLRDRTTLLLATPSMA